MPLCHHNRAGLLPADSDYRMFSYKHYGSLPGLDIAFLLDGAAYHTDRDTVDRLRPGTLQVLHSHVLTLWCCPLSRARSKS